MRIFCNGCSYTWGSELKDHKKSRYSTLLGQMFDAEVVNIARSGSSLQRLLRSTYERCDPSKYDVAILQFTLPTRTEYYVDGMGESRKDSFMRVLPQVTTTAVDFVRKKLKIADNHLEYQQSYYKTAYSVEMAQTFEFMVFQALQDYFARHNVPVVTMTLSNESVLPFDLKINTKDIPRAKHEHPNELGHRFIAKKLEPLIKERLRNGNNYVDVKKFHLDRLKRDHEKILKESDHTDYN